MSPMLFKSIRFTEIRPRASFNFPRFPVVNPIFCNHFMSETPNSGRLWFIFIMFFGLFVAALCFYGVTTAIDENKSKASEITKQIDAYTTELIGNDRIREVYVNCLLDKGPCINDATDIKKLVPEAVERGCAKCSEMQRKIIEKMMYYLKERQPDILKMMTVKYDPKGTFMKTFLEKLQGGGSGGVVNKSVIYDPQAPKSNITHEPTRSRRII